MLVITISVSKMYVEHVPRLIPGSVVVQALVAAVDLGHPAVGQGHAVLARRRTVVILGALVTVLIQMTSMGT